MLHQTFYWQTQRKLIASFITLFSSVYVSRYEKNGNNGNILSSIKVPIRYGSGDKTIIHNEEKPDPQKNVRTKISLPRMSVELTGMQYAGARKLNTLGHTSGASQTGEGFLKQLNPVPYDFSFELNIQTKTAADMLQIVEQIVPNFTPSFNLNVSMIPELGLVKDVPVELVNVAMTEQFDGAMEESRIVVWKMTFVCKAFLFPVIRDAALIKKVIATLYKQEDLSVDSKTGTVTVYVDPLDAMPTDPHEIITEIEED